MKHNKLEDFTSILAYDSNDFTPSGVLCYHKDKADSEVSPMMPSTPLKKLYNLCRYIQHLILKAKYDCYEDFDNPLDEDNWLLQRRGKYMKIVIYHTSNVTEQRQSSNQKLVSFKKGIKMEETAYPTLKEERNFDAEVYTLLLSHMNVKKC